MFLKSNMPFFRSVYQRNNARGMAEEHEKSLGNHDQRENLKCSNFL